MIYPIGFSIPKKYIVDKIPEKKKLLGHVIPNNLDTYVFHDEASYYQDYKDSCFAWTRKKDGWDCLRHYEILACGTIPIFHNLENCPMFIMDRLPKQLIMEANRELAKDMSKYNFYAEKLLNHTRQHLTTEAMANYVLAAAGHPNAKRILYLSQDVNRGADYMRDLILHGLKEICGSRCHDYPRIDFLYSDYPHDTRQLYGRGFTYSKHLDPTLHETKDELAVLEGIRDEVYDVIVYGSVHRDRRFWDVVNMFYPPEKIILICGEDSHSDCPLFDLGHKGYKVFMRELDK